MSGGNRWILDECDPDRIASPCLKSAWRSTRQQPHRLSKLSGRPVRFERPAARPRTGRSLLLVAPLEVAVGTLACARWHFRVAQGATIPGLANYRLDTEYLGASGAVADLVFGGGVNVDSTV